jgi:hypothetical protein
VTGLRQALLSVAAQWVRDGRRLMFQFSGRALRAPTSLFTHIPLSALEADSILLLQERYCRLNAPVKFSTAFPERVALHTGGVPRLVVYTYIPWVRKFTATPNSPILPLEPNDFLQEGWR